jgi:hypothetical protein
MLASSTKSTSTSRRFLLLFDHLAGTPAILGNPTVIPGVGVTHLRYSVRKA